MLTSTFKARTAAKKIAQAVNGAGLRTNNAIYEQIFGMAESAEAMRVAGSIFGSMQHVAGSVQQVGIHEQAISSYVFPSGVGMWAASAMSGLTASGVGMSGLTASGVGMSGIAMFGVGMSGMTMSGVGMSGMTMSGVGMSGMTMSGVGMSGMTMSGFGMSGLTMSGFGMS